MLGKVLGQQAEEAEEDFFDALLESVLADAVLLDGRKVGEEEIVEYAQAVVGQGESHLLIVYHHLHQFAQAEKIVGIQREYGRGEFYHREVCRADGIAHGGQTECEVLVAQQTDAAVVAGGREDRNFKPRRIGIEIALVQRQLLVIIQNFGLSSKKRPEILVMH